MLFIIVLKLQIPKKVKSIGYYAFLGCESIKNVKIQGNVNRIGGRAFDSCTKLKEVSSQNPYDNLEKIFSNGELEY